MIDNTITNDRSGTYPARRYVLVSNGLALGGAETQTVRLATALVGRGHEVKILSILPSTAFAAEVAEAGIEVLSLIHI